MTHPPHMQRKSEETVYQSLPKNILQTEMRCAACGETYATRRRDDLPDNISKGPGHDIVHGPAWCFQGKHRASVLPEHDLRRSYEGSIAQLNFFVGQARDETNAVQIQRIIDALPKTHPRCKILVIRGGHHGEDVIRPVLNLALPFLEEVQVINFEFSAITLD